MIIKGKTRAHARALGRYLLSEKNDHVEVHEVGAAGLDHLHQPVPRLYKRRRALFLEPRGQGVDVDAGAGEVGEDLFAIAAIG